MEKLDSILVECKFGQMSVKEARDKVLLLFNVSISLPPKCSCGQNKLPYINPINKLSCSRCGNDC